MATNPNEPAHPLPPTPLPEPENRKARSDLGLRVLTAAVLVPIVLYVIVAGGLPYMFVVLAFGMLAQKEFYQLIEGKGGRPIATVGLVFGAAVILVAYLPIQKLGSGYSAVLLLTASLLVSMVAQLRKAQITEALASISGTFFGVFYVAWLISHAVLLRFFDQAVKVHFDSAEIVTLEIQAGTGVFLMIFTLAVVVLCDAGAYFAGRAWGRRKLAPRSARTRASRAPWAASSSARRAAC